MAIRRFPCVDKADKHGLLAIGGDLEVESLLLAYRNGIFPWPYDEEALTWFAPPKRAVLLLNEFHVSKSLERVLKRTDFCCRMDTDFRSVIEQCAELKNRGNQSGSWITDEMVDAYCEMFRQGYAHSFEAYCEEKLVGGIYGVQIGRFFGAESSFYREPNASKVAMCFMADYLRQQGMSWFDCQVLTPFSENFGAREISRVEFMGMLAEVV